MEVISNQVYSRATDIAIPSNQVYSRTTDIAIPSNQVYSRTTDVAIPHALLILFAYMTSVDQPPF